MAKRPNVLIIYPDQMRADIMGCAGNPVVRTPNIDRLAGQGVRFDSACTSFPLCCPFRASVMTGKYAHAHGMMANHHPIRLDQTFLAEVFSDAGYQTGYVGKWHLDGGGKVVYVPPDRRLGFDWFVGFNRGHEYLSPLFYRNEDPRPRTADRFEPDVQTDHLIEFLELARLDADERPFMAMVSYGPPHPPLDMPDRLARMYDPADMPVRANTPDNAETQKASREFLAGYYGLMTGVDENVGRVLDWLDEAGLADDTIVYFVSDHGELAFEHALRGKNSAFEASMHVPLMVRWPARLAGGSVAGALVDAAVDTMPTLLDLCGLEIPQCVQGESFAPVLLGQADRARDAIFYQLIGESNGPERIPLPERGLRTDKWLYVRIEGHPTALFDLASDRLEMNNLVDAPTHADIVRQLDRQLGEQMRATGDDWSMRAPFPPPDFLTHAEGHQAYIRDQARAIVEG